MLESDYVIRLDRKLKDIGIPITGVDSDGGIYFLPEATEEQKQVAEGIASSFDPNIYTDEELRKMAFDKAEIYVKNFFTETQLLAMVPLLMAQNNKAIAVSQWVNLVRQEALINWQNPNFDQFTPPPYTYLEVMGVSL